MNSRYPGQLEIARFPRTNASSLPVAKAPPKNVARLDVIRFGQLLNQLPYNCRFAQAAFAMKLDNSMAAAGKCFHELVHFSFAAGPVRSQIG